MSNSDKRDLTRKDLEDIRLAMHGRLLRCPVGDNPETCPLHDIRLLPVAERYMWLDSKTDEEIVHLFDQHVDCLGEKIYE